MGLHSLLFLLRYCFTAFQHSLLHLSCIYMSHQVRNDYQLFSSWCMCLCLCLCLQVSPPICLARYYLRKCCTFVSLLKVLLIFLRGLYILDNTSKQVDKFSTFEVLQNSGPSMYLGLNVYMALPMVTQDSITYV